MPSTLRSLLVQVSVVACLAIALAGCASPRPASVDPNAPMHAQRLFWLPAHADLTPPQRALVLSVLSKPPERIARILRGGDPEGRLYLRIDGRDFRPWYDGDECGITTETPSSTWLWKDARLRAFFETLRGEFRPTT